MNGVPHSTITQTSVVVSGGLAGFRGLAGLRRGATGERVELLQWGLNGYGATPLLDTDGRFGPLTEAAVKDFQRMSGMVETGELSAYWEDQLIEDGRRYRGGGGSTSSDGGSSSGGGSNNRVGFTWRQPSVMPWYNFSVWSDEEEDELKRELERAGFSDVQVSHAPGLAWALIVSGVAPSGLTSATAISSRVQAVARGVGFEPDSAPTINTYDLTGAANTRNDGGGGNRNERENNDDGKGLLDDAQEWLDKNMKGLTVTTALVGLAIVGLVLQSKGR